MPRGFLIKRSSRISAVSRTHDMDREARHVDLPGQAPVTDIPGLHSDVRGNRVVTEPLKGVQVEPENEHSLKNAETTGSTGFTADITHLNVDDREYWSLHPSGTSYPLQPIGAELKKFQRILGSPIKAELPASVCMEELLSPRSPFPPQDSGISATDQLRCTRKRGHREPHSIVKMKVKNPRLNYEAEVATSPASGFKMLSSEITLFSRHEKPLGKFICQLCGEEHPDPFSLAHHKCPGIVRVEYRCPECDKAFNSPANLASHRRWHKPRSSNHEKSPDGRAELALRQDSEKSSVQGQDHVRNLWSYDQHHLSPDSSPCSVQAYQSAYGILGRKLSWRSKDSSVCVEHCFRSQGNVFDGQNRREMCNTRFCCTTYGTSVPCFLLPGVSQKICKCLHFGKTFRNQPYPWSHLASQEIA